MALSGPTISSTPPPRSSRSRSLTVWRKRRKASLFRRGARCSASIGRTARRLRLSTPRSAHWPDCRTAVGLIDGRIVFVGGQNDGKTIASRPEMRCGVRQLGVLKPWAPTRSYGLAACLDTAYRPVTSLHSRANGRRHGITGCLAIGGRLFFCAKGDGVVASCGSEALTS
jgi:hypothetical protein